MLRLGKGGQGETKTEKGAIKGTRDRPGQVTDNGSISQCSLQKQNDRTCIFRERDLF